MTRLRSRSNPLSVRLQAAIRDNFLNLRHVYSLATALSSSSDDSHLPGFLLESAQPDLQTQVFAVLTALIETAKKLQSALGIAGENTVDASRKLSYPAPLPEKSLLTLLVPYHLSLNSAKPS